MILEQVILSLNLVCTIQESVREMHGNMEPATPPRTYTYEARTNLHESCVERFPSSVVFQNTQTNNNPNQHSTISWPVWVPKRWCWYPSQLWNRVKTADVAESLWSQPGFHASFREVGRRVLACCSQVAGDIIRVWLLIWFEEYFRHCQRFLGLNVFGPKAVLQQFGGGIQCTSATPPGLLQTLPTVTRSHQQLNGGSPTAATSNFGIMKRTAGDMDSQAWRETAQLSDLSMILPPPENKVDNGKSTIWRCMSHWTWGFSKGVFFCTSPFLNRSVPATFMRFPYRFHWIQRLLLHISVPKMALTSLGYTPCSKGMNQMLQLVLGNYQLLRCINFLRNTTI